MTATAAPIQPEVALTAFVRGIERRGLALAEAQCGDPQGARAATVAAGNDFLAQAASLPLAQWPTLFWRLLLAQPALHVAAIPTSRDVLAQLSAGPRAALLLRLVGALDEAQGADVLRVSPEAYRHALQRAMHTLQELGVDEASMRDLRDRLQHRARLAPVHQFADTERHAPPLRINAPRAPRWLRTILGLLLALLLATLIASFFWQPAFLKNRAVATNRFEALRQHAPAATLSPVAAAMAGADFDLLDDPDGERIARDLDLYAWYAAGAPLSGQSTPAQSAPNQSAPAPLPESAVPERSAPDAETNPAEGGDAQ